MNKFKSILYIGEFHNTIWPEIVKFVKHNHLFIFTHSNKSEAEKIKNQLVIESSNSKVHYVILNISTLNGVCDLLEFVNQKCSKIDVLIFDFYTANNQFHKKTLDGFYNLPARNLIVPYFFINQLLKNINYPINILFSSTIPILNNISTKLTWKEIVKSISDTNKMNVLFLILWYDLQFTNHKHKFIFYTYKPRNYFNSITNILKFEKNLSKLEFICFSKEISEIYGVIINENLFFYEIPKYASNIENRSKVINFINNQLSAITLLKTEHFGNENNF